MLASHRCRQSISTALQRLLSPSQTVVVNEHLIYPTSGRWLWNETHQLSLHTRRFDVKALEDVAARAMGAEPRRGSIRIQKLAEGASNKVLIAIGHGQRAIVKIPDPVVPAHFVTASEVLHWNIYGPNWRFQCLRCLHGVQPAIIPSDVSILSWRRHLEML
jgi:hypothetical protein